MGKEITIELKHPEIIILVFLLGIIFYLELQVTLNTPINFGDEGFHARISQWIGEEIEIPIWVPALWTRLVKHGLSGPPLWWILQGSFILIFGHVIMKFLVPFIAIMIGLTIFVFIRKLYNEKIAFVAAIMSITLPSFVTYSVLVYKDILLVFYMTLFFLSFILSRETKNKKYWILTGIFGSFAFLSKPAGATVYIFVGIMFLYELIKERIFFSVLKKYLILILIIVSLHSTFLLRNFILYKTPSCDFYLPFFSLDGCNVDEFQEKYQFAGRVEQIGTEQSVLAMGITNYLNFAYGNIWFVVFAFLCGLILILFRQNSTDILVLIVLVAAIPILYRTVPHRAEDAARHIISWSSAVAIVGGIWVNEIYVFIKKYQKHLAMIIFIFVIFFSFQNLREKLDIMFRVKQFSPLYFESCEWIKKNVAEDAVLLTIWSNRAIYNCQRNVVGHMADISLSKDLNYILHVAKQNGITHLFIQKFSIDFRNRHFSENYDLDFIQFLENHPENFKKIYENGLPLQQCIQQGGCDGNIIYQIVY